MAYRRQWLRPFKLREYYLDGRSGVGGIQDAVYQLYWAVVDGRLRARHEGRILSSEEIYELRRTQWSSGGVHRCELPHDIELSVEDALMIWGNDGQASINERVAPESTGGAALAESRVATVVKPKRRMGPTPGNIRRYDKDDRALFPKIRKYLKQGLSLRAATIKLAEANKVAGVGSPPSRAKRVAKLYRQ